MEKIRACLFDLDGVIVDTARYHYLAWKQLANELGIDFTPESNELLKGVSRMRSLEIILELGNRTLTEGEKIAFAEKKNAIYLDYIRQLPEEEILPGVRSFIGELKNNHIGVVLGSASKNATLILQQLKIMDLFDVIIDGNKVSRAKPDPEIFLKGAEELHVPAGSCVVFEDAIAGIEAARNAGMFCVGVGDRNTLYKADLVIPGFEGFTLADLESIEHSIRSMRHGAQGTGPENIEYFDKQGE
jgi:beta-phosphoglucomutase